MTKTPSEIAAAESAQAVPYGEPHNQPVLTRRRALAGLLAVPALGSAASAQDWSPFHDKTGSVRPGAGGETYDREFVRQWEAKPPPGYPTLASANVEATKAALKRYTDIVARGGWPLIPDVQMQMEPGGKGPAIAQLRQRLMLSGDLREPTNYPEFFDSYLDKAVKRFQASNGLSPTSIVDKRTLVALNVPAAARLRQLQANVPRLQDAVRNAGKKYVLVNIPAAQIEAVEGERVISRHSGVVGKIERPSPLLKSAIHELNFNPVWHLPPTVIEKDLAPKGRDMQRSGKSVLAQYGIDAYDGTGKKLDPAAVDWNAASVRNLSFKQQPGKDNPLGFVKINFHNQFSVYMHSTPSETLFGRNFRADSSGCVRVMGIDELVTWLLRDNGDWTHERVIKMKQTGERMDVRLKRIVPLTWAYITAWATEDGVVQFRRDLYQRDGLGPIAATY
jgi:L,D-transpeptidase YcbB